MFIVFTHLLVLVQLWDADICYDVLAFPHNRVRPPFAKGVYLWDIYCGIKPTMSNIEDSCCLACSSQPLWWPQICPQQSSGSAGREWQKPSGSELEHSIRVQLKNVSRTMYGNGPKDCKGLLWKHISWFDIQIPWLMDPLESEMLAPHVAPLLCCKYHNSPPKAAW